MCGLKSRSRSTTKVGTEPDAIVILIAPAEKYPPFSEQRRLFVNFARQVADLMKYGYTCEYGRGGFGSWVRRVEGGEEC